MTFSITRTCRNFTALQDIESRAARKFTELGYRSEDWPVTSIEEFSQAEASGRLLACVHDGRPVGFVIVDMFEAILHVQELDTDPDFMQQGVASKLLEEVVRTAGAGYHYLSLRTFKTAPWSMGLYRKFGFSELSTDAPEAIRRLSAEKAATEKSLGLPTEDRITMIRALTGHQ